MPELAVTTADLSMLGIAWKIARGLAIAYVVLFAVIFVGQRRMIYVPTGPHHAPASLGLFDVVEQKMTTPDRETIVLWTRPARHGQPTIVYFHGNSGSVSHRHETFRLFLNEGYGLAAMSYRGFSGSSGSPSETNNVADGLQVYDLLRQSGVQPRDIVLFGESLGSGIAVQVAAARDVAAVILESPYSSVADIAAHRLPYLPARLATLDRYDSVRHVRDVKAPVLILAGSTDTVVPIQFTRMLAAAIPGKKRYIEYPRGWHVDTFQHGGFDEVRTWIAEHRHAASAH